MELSDRPYGFTSLLDRKVVDQSGRRLGHAFELIGRKEVDGSFTIEEILVGKAAILRRLKGPGFGGERIPWEAVVEIHDDRIVIRR